MEKVFKLVTRGAGRLFEHSSALADDNALVRLSLAVNNRIDIEDILILTLRHLLHTDSYSVRNFVL